jgi:hypothetical protein
MEETEMLIDLCPGEWLRVGDATLLVLDIKGSRIQFALEDVPHTLNASNANDRKDHGCDPPFPAPGSPWLHRLPRRVGAAATSDKQPHLFRPV